MDARAYDELERLNGAVGRHRRGNFDELIDTIIHPAQEIYGWIETIDGDHRLNYTVLTGAAHHRAFVLVYDRQTSLVSLRIAAPDDLFDVFMAQLPRVPQATSGRPIMMEHAAFHAITTTEERPAVNPAICRQTRIISSILRQPRLGGGNLYAATRNHGIRKRIAHPVNYIDTVHGRWLTTLAASDGCTMIAMRPASLNIIRKYLYDAATRLQ